jgi:hypothetical protein
VLAWDREWTRSGLVAGSSAASRGERIGDAGPSDIIGDTVREGMLKDSEGAFVRWEVKDNIDRKGGAETRVLSMVLMGREVDQQMICSEEKVHLNTRSIGYVMIK